MPSWDYEDKGLKAINKNSLSIENSYVAGVDEVGRGCLAGPVVACAVVFKHRKLDFLLDINDSKKLSKSQREKLYNKLRIHTFYTIGLCTHEEIDKINIFQASLLAMKRAYNHLCELCTPLLVLVDGNKTLDIPVKNYAIIKGDSKSYSIAAASIIAKVYRDELMKQLAQEENNQWYGWEKNAGYATKVHKQAILTYGISKYHRRSFSPIKEMIYQS